MRPNLFSSRPLAQAISLALTMAVATPVLAQTSERTSRAERTTAISGGAAAASERARLKREAKQQEAQAEEETPSNYPQATREAPKVHASAKGAAKLQAMMDAYNKKSYAEVRTLGDAIVADPKSNAYEKAFAAQSAAYAAYESEDSAAARAYFAQAISANGLDNNGHFGAMYTLAQLQVQDELYTEALTTIDRFLSESRSSNPEHLVLKGNALYRMEKYPEAATVLRQALASTDTPRSDWQALLMGALSESGDAAGATKLAAEVAAKNPGDKRSQLNLASAFQQSGQDAQAIAVLERLRTAGQLSEAQEYRLLYSLYANSENKEAEAIKVINEGLAKGLLKADFNTQLALAQAYYFSDQMPQAIDAYKKAAPLDTTGETYLNLAKVLWQADRGAEAKEAARQAKAKGLKNPAEADKVIANAGK